MMWEIVHHNVELGLPRICAAQASERLKEINDSLSLMNRSSQTIAVNVVESQKLLGARQPPIRCPKSVRVLNSSPMRTMNRLEFQRPPLVKAQNSTVLWSLIIEFENAVFFSRIVDPETPSRFLSAVWTDPRGAAISVSTRC